MQIKFFIKYQALGNLNWKKKYYCVVNGQKYNTYLQVLFLSSCNISCLTHQLATEERTQYDRGINGLDTCSFKHSNNIFAITYLILNITSIYIKCYNKTNLCRKSTAANLPVARKMNMEKEYCCQKILVFSFFVIQCMSHLEFLSIAFDSTKYDRSANV